VEGTSETKTDGKKNTSGRREVRSLVTCYPGMVAQACNPSYSGSRGRRILSLRASPSQIIVITIIIVIIIII
jgi:hypothetical protein